MKKLQEIEKQIDLLSASAASQYERGEYSGSIDICDQLMRLEYQAMQLRKELGLVQNFKA